MLFFLRPGFPGRIKQFAAAVDDLQPISDAHASAVHTSQVSTHTNSGNM